MRTLSARQRHILNYVTLGLTNKEIAAELGVSEQCVKGHVSRLFDRYGVEGRVELVSYAASLGYADERWTATARSPLATILRRVDGFVAMALLALDGSAADDDQRLSDIRTHLV